MEPARGRPVRRAVAGFDARRLVWVGDAWNPRAPRPAGIEARPLAHGRWLYVLKMGRRPVEHAGYQLTRVTAVARR